MLNYNRGDFNEILLGFIEIIYQSVIHEALYLDVHLSQVPGRII